MPRSRSIVRTFRVFTGALTGIVALACGRADGRGANGGAGHEATASTASGQQLAARYCQSCHVLPTPDLLDRTSWDQWVLPRMARRLGLRGVGDRTHLELIEGGIAGRLIRAAHVFPDSAVITRAEWDRLAGYYLREAPAALAAAVTPTVATGLPGFRLRTADFHLPTPMVSLVHVDQPHGRIYVGNATPGQNVLAVLDGRGHQIMSHQLPSPVSNLRVRGDTLGLLFMGQLNPSDVPRGSLAVISGWAPNAAPAVAWEVDTLQRPVFASYADLNGDGLDDAVVSEFGNMTGRLAWYERLASGGSRRHLLTTQPGALNTVVRDFDGDGRLDILALTAQADEGVSLFHGRAGGEFTRERVLRFPPSYGSSSMDVVDVDGDGSPDIVYTNGDNGDYPSPRKPYHGIHIFLNDGHGRFAEKYFFPMPGAYKAIARDFDGDGKIDIAAIAFYPDYAAPAPLPFVYLQGLGGLRFTPRTFPDANRGRWLTMDAGDVNGDGADDIVLGAFAAMDGPDDRRGISARWRTPGAPTVLILENTRAKTRAHARGGAVAQGQAPRELGDPDRANQIGR